MLYRLSAKTKLSNGTEWAGIGVNFWKNGTKVQSNTARTVSTSYSESALTITAPAAFDSAAVFGWKNAGTGLLRLDDFLLTPCLTEATDPTPSVAVVNKKGVGTWYWVNEAKALNAIGAQWYYNWTLKPEYGYTGSVPFVPMFWGASSVTTDNITAIKASKYEVVLGFNEPNRSDQANMTVARALELWPRLMETGKRLGSPAMAGDPSVSGSWLEQFMQGAKDRGYRVDFITMHPYLDATNPAGAVDKLKAMIDRTYAKYRLPIWITEYGPIAIAGWSQAATWEQSAEYARRSVTMLNSLTMVERYAWFALPPDYRAEYPTNMLSNNDGSLTSVGNAYRDAK